MRKLFLTFLLLPTLAFGQSLTVGAVPGVTYKPGTGGGVSGGGSVSGTTNQVGKFTAATTIGDSGIADDGTTIEFTTEPLEAVEIVAPSGIASSDVLYGDSTAHRFKMNNNNGTAITVAGMITGTASITPGTITASTCADSATTVTVTAAAVGDACALGTPAAGAGTHISATCYISATSTAKVRFCNSNTADQTGTTGTYRATVVK